MIAPILITAPDAPPPNGHYSHGAVSGSLVFTSAQLPMDPADPDAPVPSLEEQVRRVIRNIEAILIASGSSLAAAVKFTVYVRDIESWPEMNRVYQQVLGPNRPARSVISVTGIHRGYDVAMEAVGTVVVPPREEG
jgi:2-iminobutanoate/2-iminopropanoate deaminase